MSYFFLFSLSLFPLFLRLERRRGEMREFSAWRCPPIFFLFNGKCGGEQSIPPPPSGVPLGSPSPPPLFGSEEDIYGRDTFSSRVELSPPLFFSFFFFFPSLWFFLQQTCKKNAKDAFTARSSPFSLFGSPLFSPFSLPLSQT